MSEEEPAQLILDVTVNGQSHGPTVLLRRGNAILVRVSDIDSWRLKRGTLTPETFNGESYIPLSAFAGLTFTIDPQLQTLDVKADVTLFEPVAIEANKTVFHNPTGGTFGAFLNYDTVGRAEPGSDTVSSFLETGMSGNWGLLTNTMVASDVPGSHSLLRYDTTYIWDDPAKLTRLSVGDAISHGATIGEQLRFAGVRYGTEFDLQPSLLTFPTPGFTGQAALPSTVQVYVNNVLTYSRDVDQGPFSINRLPATNGAGTMQVVVKDPLGVERAYQVPFYVGTGNLRNGLTDFSIEAGAERQNYGAASFDYSLPYGAVTYRHGYSDALTLGGHLEGDSRSQMLEGDISVLAGQIGEFGGAIAGSTGAGGTGGFGEVSFRHAARSWNVQISYEAAVKNFSQDGVTLPDNEIRQQLQLGAGFSTKHYGSFSVSYIDMHPASGADSRVLTTSYNIQINKYADLNSYVLLTDQRGTPRTTTVGITLIFPLGPRNNASLQMDHQQGRFDEIASYSKTPPTDRGFGYNISVAHDTPNYGTGSLTWVNSASTITATVDHRNDQTSGMLEAAGSIGYAGGTAFFARQIGNAYGIVDLPDRPGVTIYQENRPIAKTDANGVVVLPNLLAYDENKLSIDPTSLPIDADIKSTELVVVPRYRSAVAAIFAVTHARSATVTLLLPDGTPIPAGALITVVEDNLTTYSGYRGEVFIDNIHSDIHLKVHREQGDCIATVGKIPDNVILPALPPMTCETANP